MFPVPLPATKQHWVYDDPSGVREPDPYLRAWPRRERKPSIRVATRSRVRLSHRHAGAMTEHRRHSEGTAEHDLRVPTASI
jgi:hypothetical protein